MSYVKSIRILSRMKCIICMSAQLNILCLICINRQNAGPDNSGPDNDGPVIGIIRPPTLSLIRGCHDDNIRGPHVPSVVLTFTWFCVFSSRLLSAGKHFRRITGNTHSWEPSIREWRYTHTINSKKRAPRLWISPM